MSEVWSAGTYERLAARFAPVQDHLVNLLAIAPGERVLDLATGTGEVAIRMAQRGAVVTGIDVAEPMLVKARERAKREGVAIAFDLGDVEYLPYEDSSFEAVVSNFGLIFAPDHANVAAELARVAASRARLGFTAWKPNPKLGELYRRFTEEPIQGREAYEWGREDHVEDMQIFQKKNAYLGGMDEAIAILKLCADDFGALTVHVLHDGDELSPWETVMTIEGDYTLFAHLETVYLGVLARRTLISTNTERVLRAAAGKPIIFMVRALEREL